MSSSATSNDHDWAAESVVAPRSATKPLIGAIDQGTSSSRFLVFSIATGELITYHQVEVKKCYPNEGWVEQNAIEIYESVCECIRIVVDRKLHDVGFSAADIQCVGVTNQRESTILWDAISGEPLYNSIVWLDNRTSDLVETIVNRIPGRDINWLKAKTGLPISTYFSALKIKWLIDNVPAVRAALAADRLRFGTVDCWLLWNLTNGKRHVTDVTNASRTLLMDIETLQWDANLCDFFAIPRTILPTIMPSAGMFGEIAGGPLAGIPITGVIGDQNAALVGQRCLAVGETKVTYGTGAFLMQNIGPGPLHGALKAVPKEARRKLLATVAYRLGDAPVCYALEGSIAIAGAAITWLRDNLQLIDNYSEVEAIARRDDSAAGLFFVPAFQGLYAPYWDANATGTIIGISQYSRKCHLVRATLDGVAFQTNDIIALMHADESPPPNGVRVDGGMSSNDLLCQILADITGARILRPKMTESTALGAAMVASYCFGLWNTFARIEARKCDTQSFVGPDRQSAINNWYPHFAHRNDVCCCSSSSSSSLSNDFARNTSSKLLLSFTGSSDDDDDNDNNERTTSAANEQMECSRSSSTSASPSLSSSVAGVLDTLVDTFYPTLPQSQRLSRVARWREAVGRSRKWIQVESQVQKRVDYLRLSVLPLGAFVLSSFALVIVAQTLDSSAAPAAPSAIS